MDIIDVKDTELFKIWIQSLQDDSTYSILRMTFIKRYYGEVVLDIDIDGKLHCLDEKYLEALRDKLNELLPTKKP